MVVQSTSPYPVGSLGVGVHGRTLISILLAPFGGGVTMGTSGETAPAVAVDPNLKPTHTYQLYISSAAQEKPDIRWSLGE